MRIRERHLSTIKVSLSDLAEVRTANAHPLTIAILPTSHHGLCSNRGQHTAAAVRIHKNSTLTYQNLELQVLERTKRLVLSTKNPLPMHTRKSSQYYFDAAAFLGKTVCVKVVDMGWGRVSRKWSDVSDRTLASAMNFSAGIVVASFGVAKERGNVPFVDAALWTLTARYQKRVRA